MKADGSMQRQLTFDKAGSYEPALSGRMVSISSFYQFEMVFCRRKEAQCKSCNVMNLDGSEQWCLTNNDDFARETIMVS